LLYWRALEDLKHAARGRRSGHEDTSSTSVLESKKYDRTKKEQAWTR